MALITCAGADVLRLRLHMPQRRVWMAWAELDTATLPSGRVTIAAADGGSWTGTIVQPSGIFLDTAHVLILAGAGGMSRLTKPAAYENAQLGDPLNAVLQAAGETLSSTVDASITGVLLGKWTITATYAGRALDELCYAASSALGQTVLWRVLADGTVWLGVETWPAQEMAAGADVLEAFPSEGRYVIGAAAPALSPGVNLAGVGNLVAVDHWITHDRVRSDAWV